MNMVFSDEDEILIKSLYLKGYTAKRLIDEFSEKSWIKHDVNELLKKLRDTGTVDRRPGSGRPRSACTEENDETVNESWVKRTSRRPTGLSVGYHWRRVFIGALKIQFELNICRKFEL